MTNVNLYLDSRLSADEVLAFGFNRVFIATGARWRKDGLGRQHRTAIDGIVDADVAPKVFSPDDVFAGAALPSPVLIYDDDHYYMAGALAERLAQTRAGGAPGHAVRQSIRVHRYDDGAATYTGWVVEDGGADSDNHVHRRCIGCARRFARATRQQLHRRPHTIALRQPLADHDA
jgi:hypothetical protein